MAVACPLGRQSLSSLLESQLLAIPSKAPSALSPQLAPKWQALNVALALLGLCLESWS